MRPVNIAQSTIVVGMGKTGLSCVRYLLAQGESVIAVDNRESPPMLAELRRLLPAEAIVTGAFDADLFLHGKQLVVSPGVSLQTAEISAALRQGVPVLGDIELFARAAPAPVVAITGSNGKSTVTALLTTIAEAAGRHVKMGGNYGTPALDLLADAETDLYVLELSSFQLETTDSLNAAAAVVLNFSPDHLDRYAGPAEYLAAKLRIYQGDGVMVINRQAGFADRLATAGRQQIGFSLTEPLENDYGVRLRDGQSWLVHGDQWLMPAADVRLSGRHNLANVLAAFALAGALGIDHEAMCTAARGFAGLPHRMQWVADIQGVTFYNDSKGTNVGATLAALEGLTQPVVLIAGGLAKGGDFSPLRDVLRDRGRALVLIGRDAELIATQLDGAIAIYRADSMRQAVCRAHQLAQAGDIVLLSPACASFDMFSGYEQRGEVYMQAVRELTS